AIAFAAIACEVGGHQARLARIAAPSRLYLRLGELFEDGAALSRIACKRDRLLVELDCARERERGGRIARGAACPFERARPITGLAMVARERLGLDQAAALERIGEPAMELAAVLGAHRGERDLAD